MEIIASDNLCILKPYSPLLNKRESLRIFEKIKSLNITSVGLDLSSVEECTIDFLTDLKKISDDVKIGVFNIQSDIFALFSFMKFDKNVELYVNELDYKDAERRLLIRRFNLV